MVGTTLGPSGAKKAVIGERQALRINRCKSNS
jgi:hypothetical protein